MLFLLTWVEWEAYTQIAYACGKKSIKVLDCFLVWSGILILGISFDNNGVFSPDQYRAIPAEQEDF